MGKEVQAFDEVLAQCGAYKLLTVECRRRRPWYTYNRSCLHFRSFWPFMLVYSVKEQHIIISNDEGCETDYYMRKLSNNRSSRENKRSCQKYQNPCF